MNKLKDFSRDERSLLLYLETCAVDLCGRFDDRRINDADRATMKEWHVVGFIDYGRIVAADANRQGAKWVELSEEAWDLAHKERRDRAARNQRRYTRSCDKE